MENAVKALTMAGSILIAVVIIGVLMFAFNNLSEQQQIETESEEARQISDYLARFEQYNKTYVYGSEILSLANLQDDYNRTQHDLEGYSRVTIKVKIKTAVERIGRSSEYLEEDRNYDIAVVANEIDGRNSSSLKKDIENYETTVYGRTGKTIKQLSQISVRQLAGILNVDFRSDDDNLTVQEKIEAQYADLMQEIDNYKTLKSTYTTFKNTQFRCTDVEYDDVGRIKEMNYEEVEILP